MIKLGPIVLGSVAHILTWIVETLSDVLGLLIFLIGVLLGQKPGLGNSVFVFVFVGVIVLVNKFALLVILDAMVELFRLLPCILKMRSLLSLYIFVFLADKLLVILAFFDNFVEMILLIFDGFLKFLTDNAFLSIGPFDKLLLDGLDSSFLLILLIQFISHLLLLFYISLAVL